jgi:hypothetical protein
MKLGRKPARFTRASFARAHVIARYLGALGPAPATSPDYVTAVTTQARSAGWGMDGNDQWGDCTCASSAHQKMVRTANAGTIVIPSMTDVLYLYAVMNGYTGSATDLNAIEAYCTANDNGADELTLEQYLENTGWMGNKLTGFANLDPTQLDQLKWGVCIFGATRLGINLPQSAMDQFNAGQPWDYVAGSPCIGGHDVPVVKYDGTYFYVVTWGQLQPVTPAFMTASFSDGTGAYIEEAHAELDAEWLEKSGSCPDGLNMAQLQADLSAIVSPTPAPPAPTPTPTPPPTPGTSKAELARLLALEMITDLANASTTEPQMKADLQSILNAN